MKKTSWETDTEWMITFQVLFDLIEYVPAKVLL